MASEQEIDKTGVMKQQPKPKKKLKLKLKCCGAKLWKGEKCKCKCKEIKTIQKYISKCQENKNKLEPIEYRGDKIKINDINVFAYKNRSKNDSYNKKRENIIACIINNKIPEQYYKHSENWQNLKIEKIKFIKELCKKKVSFTLRKLIVSLKQEDAIIMTLR